MSWTGEDPGQGDPDGITALAAELNRVADAASSAQTSLLALKDNTTDAIWRGKSADGFRHRMAKLPGHLAKLAHSYREAADGFAAYAASVRQIEHDAVIAQAAMSSAQSAVTAARDQQAEYVAPAGAPDSTNSYEDALAHAKSHVTAATSGLQALGDDRRVADTRVKASLKHAHRAGMKNKSGWVRFWESVAKVLVWVAIALIVIAVVCVALALPAIMAAFLVSDGLLSGLAFAGATALEAGLTASAVGVSVGAAMSIVGAASLVSEGILVSEGEGSWKSFSLDAALTIAPGLLVKGAKYLREVTVLVQGRRTARATPRGVGVGWISRAADSGRGRVWQKPGSTRNSDMIRIMEPTQPYPYGYVRFYNKTGQPIGLDGKPGPKSATHIPRRSDGTYPLPIGWAL